MYPIVIKIGPIIVYSYGVMVSLAFALGTFLLWRNAPRVGIRREKVLDLTIVILLSGIIGARVLHVLVNIGYYLENPIQIIMLTRGGLAFYGGLFSALIAALIFIKKNSMPVWQVGDLLAPFVALGQAIGRLGCFLNGCCYGIASTFKGFGIIFPSDTILRYPVQLYSVISLLFIYAVLRVLFEKGYFKGNLFLLYLVFYSFYRFFIEFLRGDLETFFCNLTISQIISIIVFIAAGTLIIRRRASWKNTSLR